MAEDQGQGGNGRVTLVLIMVIALLFAAAVLISVYSLKEKAEQQVSSAPIAVAAPQ